MQGEKVSANVGCSAYEGEMMPKWFGTSREGGWLDVNAGVDGEGWCGFVVVNVIKQREWEMEMKGLKVLEVVACTVTGSRVWVTNVHGNDQKVVARESTWGGQRVFTFPKHSLAMVRWRS